jgi:5-(carboxyamino)imidazole ribonucleotide synthase
MGYSAPPMSHPTGHLSPILPGATIGILGGGQLGRMTALAARSLGYQVRVLDPDPGCAARPVVEHVLAASFEDANAAAELASHCDVVTLEIEKVSTAGLRAAARLCPVRPGAAVLEIVQDKGRQKGWLAAHGFPVGPFREARNVTELREAIAALGSSCFVKSCTGGYDGRGQFESEKPDDAEEAWSSLGCAPVVVEKSLALESELSIMVARSPRGEVTCYPVALNHHEDRVLAWSVLPGPVAPEISARAEEIARGLADKLQLEGVLAVELFLVGGEILVNELAPRPHNTFHHTEVACTTSQFEQVVRAVCGLPLGSTEVLRPAAIANLLGPEGGRGAPFDHALAVPGVHLFLYGKRDARPGRKMGHLSATGRTPEEALARVLEAKSRLSSAAIGSQGLPR